jgi:hypothetical protein
MNLKTLGALWNERRTLARQLNEEKSASGANRTSPADPAPVDAATHPPMDSSPMGAAGSPRVSNDRTILRLRRTPVHFVNRDETMNELPNFISAIHGYAVIGDPGKGSKSGASYFGVSGDAKRAGVRIDKGFIKEVNARNVRGQHKYDAAVRRTVQALAGTGFPTREAFQLAYRQARLAAEPGLDDAIISHEMKRLSFIVPQSSWEVWPLEPNGPQAERPNYPEEDVRHFEKLTGRYRRAGKGRAADPSGDAGAPPVRKFDSVSLRKLPDVDALALIEAKREWLLHRSFVDEKLGRDEGAEIDPATVSGEQSAAAKRYVSTYQRTPPFVSPATANCNASTKALLLQAQANAHLLPASASAVGFSHRARVWTPVPVPAPAADGHVQPEASVDRGQDIDVTEIMEHEARNVALSVELWVDGGATAGDWVKRPDGSGWRPRVAQQDAEGSGTAL